MDTVIVTVPLTVNETLKWFSSLPIFMQKSFFGGDSVESRIVSRTLTSWDLGASQYLSGDNSALDKTNERYK